MKLVRLSKRVAAAVTAAVLCACVLAVVPDVARAEETTPVAIVQGTLPIGSDEEYDKSLQPTGYAPKTSAAQVFSAEANDVSAEGPLPCGTPSAPAVPEGLDPHLPPVSALSLDDEAAGQAITYQIGDKRRFFSHDREAEGFDARLVAVGETYTIWIEQGYDLFEDEDLKTFENELDGAITKVYEAFGTAKRVDFDKDGRIAFVFHEFGESMQGAAGFLWNGDMYTKEELEAIGYSKAAATNHLDMLHLSTENFRTQEGELSFNRNYVMPTLVHELQHLVTFAQVETNAETWMNEAFSQAAVALTGYGHKQRSSLQILGSFFCFGVGVSFVFDGWYTPTEHVNANTGTSTYAQWYVFSRYLANQTKGFTSNDGLRGGDELYLSVFNCDRGEDDLGACTKTSLIHTLEKIGYLGQGKSCVVKDFDELISNYNTALLVRNTTGPWSLTNDQGADPSLIDGAPMPLLEVVEGAVPQWVYGGGAAVYVGLDRDLEKTGKGVGIEEWTVNSPLPLLYEYEVSPPHKSTLRDGDPLSIRAVEPTAADGFALEYCTLTAQQWMFPTPYEWSFQEYTGPLAFDADRPFLAVRFACDRGATDYQVFYFEADTSDPGEDPGPDPGGDDPKPEPEPDPGDTGDSGDDPADEVAPPAKGDGAPDDFGDKGDSRGGDTLAPTGDPLTYAVTVLVALAVLGGAGGVSAAALRRRKQKVSR